MEANMSINGWWMDKDVVLYTNNGRLFSHKKKKIPTCYSMDGLWKHYVKWMISLICGIFQTTTTNSDSEPDDCENSQKVGVGWNGWRWSKVTNFNYKINNYITSWGCNVQYVDTVNNTALYLKVAMRINHKSSIGRKNKVVCVVTGVKLDLWSFHNIYTHTESLCTYLKLI